MLATYALPKTYIRATYVLWTLYGYYQILHPAHPWAEVSRPYRPSYDLVDRGLHSFMKFVSGLAAIMSFMVVP